MSGWKLDERLDAPKLELVVGEEFFNRNEAHKRMHALRLANGGALTDEKISRMIRDVAHDKSEKVSAYACCCYLVGVLFSYVFSQLDLSVSHLGRALPADLVEKFLRDAVDAGCGEHVTCVLLGGYRYGTHQLRSTATIVRFRRLTVLDFAC